MKALTASRAQDFANRIEKVILSEINRMLPEAIESSKLHSISQKLNSELIEIFESETVKVEDATPRAVGEKVAITVQVAPAAREAEQVPPEPG